LSAAEREPRPAGPPRAGILLGRLVAPLDALFDRLYGARWNPLHQTGNLAILCFLVTLVTGLYLFLFYKIADPWGSVARIQASIWGGGWARSMHRYSADLAVVAIALHVLRKLIQGHTWGPRAWAWVSGVLLLAAAFACGWTGLVLVWDLQAQRIAVEGARLFDLLPIFAEPISRTFAGVEPVGSSFFFVNLFLHLALPLGLVALLAIHVTRIARPALLPPRRLMAGALATLGLLSFVWAVELPPRADLRALPGAMPVDLFYAFWLPAAGTIPTPLLLALWIAGLGGLAAFALLWRPTPPIAVSTVDEDHCSGCTSCYHDCPYEAISMVRRERPSRQTSEYVARVDPELCVGCGICAAACAPMGVGPEGRDGREQLVAARAFADRARPTGVEIAILGCGTGHARTLAPLAGPRRSTWIGGCAGSIHSSAIELLLRRGFAGVLLLSCPPRDCRYREGPRWLEERLFQGHDAPLPERVDRRRVAIVSRSASELREIRAELASFESGLAGIRVVGETTVAMEPECDREEAEKRLREAIGA